MDEILFYVILSKAGYFSDVTKTRPLGYAPAERERVSKFVARNNVSVSISFSHQWSNRYCTLLVQFLPFSASDSPLLVHYVLN